MLVFSSNNPTPEIGQILYIEHKSENGEFEYASLIFVDEEPVEGKQWMYTQIAVKEGLGRGVEVYLGFEAGGMPNKYTGIATDEDILDFIKLINEGSLTEDSPNLEAWIECIKKDKKLLTKEKERIVRLISRQN